MSQVEDLRSAAALLRDAATGDMPPGPWQMHKPVGLALADLLDEHARQVEAVSGKVAKALDPRPEYTRLARLILAGGGS